MKVQRFTRKKAKKWHDKHILRKEFCIGQSVLVYDSKLHLFSGNFKSRWFGPCIIKRDLGHGAFEVQSATEGSFKVNGQRMKHYVVGEKLDPEDTVDDDEQGADTTAPASADS